MGFRNLTATLGVGLVLVYAIGSGVWVSRSPGWYSSLNRPSWQPPDFVFGVIWPYNFIVLGIVSFQVAQRMSRTTSLIWLIFFALSIITALLWAYHFYVPHNLHFEPHLQSQIYLSEFLYHQKFYPFQLKFFRKKL